MTVHGLPKSVRVGPHDVRFVPLKEKEAKSNYGTFVPMEMEIRLHDKYASGSMAVDTALHEVLHAIFAVGTVQVKQGEEHVVSALATYLTQIIRDNPEFVKWMQQTVAK